MALSLTWTATKEDASGLATVTYNAGGDPSCGTAASDRIVIVAAWARANSTSGITSCTIGGVSGTHVASSLVTDPTTSMQADIWYAAVPTGTTCTVTIVWANTNTFDSAISVWRLTGAISTPTVATTASAGVNAGTNLALSPYTVPSGGAALNLYANRGGNGLSNSVTWTNATSQFSNVTAGLREYGGGLVTASGSVTVTASDITGSDNSGANQAVLTSAAWGPAATVTYVYSDPQFPIRSKIDYRMLGADSKQSEQWPFTATPNPLKMQGIYYDPQFPIRRKFRTFQSNDEQWIFTAVKTPTQFGWDNPEKFPQRKRFRTFQSNDDEWLFTAVPTPGQFGWDNPERFPFRLRFRTFQSPDEQWPFTAVPTLTQFGWDNPEKFPLRKRFRTFQSADEQWPFTAVPTPTQLGFLFPDPPPIRPLPRQLALSSKQDEEWPFLIIIPPLVIPYDAQFPIRAKFRPFQSEDEQWPFTAVLTPAQTGFLTQDPLPVLQRYRVLALDSKRDDQLLLISNTSLLLEGAWYVDQTFPPVTAASPGAWFSPHAWFIKVI